MPRTEGRLKSLLWPSIRNGNDVDYLGAQGYWVCALVAVGSFVLSLFVFPRGRVQNDGRTICLGKLLKINEELPTHSPVTLGHSREDGLRCTAICYCLCGPTMLRWSGLLKNLLQSSRNSRET
jgi:hypothetical protein